MFLILVAPEATTTPHQDINLSGSLTVSCDYMGVPTPSIVWTHNNTELNDSNADITISTSDTNSMLMRTNLDRNAGGDYNCIFTNSLGADNVSVIEVRILSKSIDSPDLVCIIIVGSCDVYCYPKCMRCKAVRLVVSIIYVCK